MKRRDFVVFAAGVAATLGSQVAVAQSDRKMARVGFLALSSAGYPSQILYRQSLQHLGYVEGQNIVLLERFADGDTSRLPVLAAELVRGNADVILATSPPAIVAARDVTRSVPIVMITGDDPVRSGYVASLARPGGNITGVTLLVLDLFAKQMELLRQLIPGLGRAAILWDPAMTSSTQDMADVQAAAMRLGLQLKVAEARGAPGDYERAFAAMSAERVEGVVIAGMPTFIRDRSRIIGLAAKHRLPAIYAFSDDVQAGGLVAYGAGQAEMIRLAVGYVDRILKGAKPSDLPVEQPTRLDLAINLKTARELAITVPAAVLARADDVIE